MAEAAYSEMVKAHDRRYFFDVYIQDDGTRRVSVKESRLVNGHRYTQTVTVWETDIVNVFFALLRCLEFFDRAEIYAALKAGHPDTVRHEKQG